MILLTVRESSLGAYTKSVQDAVLAGYRMSEEPSKYPWNDTQFNAVFEEVEFTEHAIDSNIVLNTTWSDDVTTTNVLIASKPQAGRPRRKL